MAYILKLLSDLTCSKSVSAHPHTMTPLLEAIASSSDKNGCQLLFKHSVIQLPDEWIGGEAGWLESEHDKDDQNRRNEIADGVPDERWRPEVDWTDSSHQLRMFRFGGAFLDDEDDERANEESHSEWDHIGKHQA